MANQISSLDQLVWSYLKHKGFDRAVEAFATDLSEASSLTWDTTTAANDEHSLEQVFNSYVESNGLTVSVPSKSKKDKKKKKKEKRKNPENASEVAEEPEQKKKKVDTKQVTPQKSEETTESTNGSDSKGKKKKKKNKNKNVETPVIEEQSKNDDAMEEEEDNDFVIKKPNQSNGTTPNKQKQNGSTPQKNGNKIVFDEEPTPEQSEKNEVISPASGKQKNSPFKRINEEEVEIADDRLKDNSYWGKKGDDYGRKANEDLIKVKGKGFRQAKTKKKKATFFGGGAIDTGVNSVRFEYSDDE